MKGGISKRVGLFFLIFGVPLLFLVILSRGEPETTKLKFYGKNLTEKGTTKINDFLFYDVDSNQITKQTYKGKTLVVNMLIPSCPSVCPVISPQLESFIYKKVLNETRLKDFMMLSHVVDTNGGAIDLKSFVQEQGDIDSDKWKFVQGSSNSLYDFDLPKANLLDTNKYDIAIGGRTFYKMVLLIDRNQYLRGIYQGDKTMELERLKQELNVLEREYASIAKELKQAKQQK